MIRKLNLGELIEFSFSTTIKKFGMFALSFLMLIGVVAIAVGAILGIFYGFGAMDSYLGPVNALTQFSAGQFAGVLIGAILAYILILIGMVWMMAFNSYVALNVVTKTSKSIAESIGYAFKKLPTFLMYSLIMFVISLVVSIPYLMSYMPIALDPGAEFSPLVILGMLFTYVTSGVICVFMALVPSLILDEGLTAVAAIKKSFSVVKSDFWRTLLYMALLFLMLIAAIYVIMIILVLIGVVVFMANMSFAMKATFVTVAVILYLLVYVIMMGVWACTGVNLYKQLYLDRKPVEETIEFETTVVEETPQDSDTPWSE